jgi:curved DNA-binding protein CbpA
MKDLYKILEVERNATSEQIKKAYYILATVYHPDKNNGKHSPEFIDINLAHTILSDEEKRKKYDDTGEYSEIEFDIHTMAMSNLASMFFGVIGDPAFNPDTHNVFLIMENSISKELEKANDKINKIESFICKMNDVKRNIIGDGLLFDEMIESNIRDNSNEVSRIDEDIKVIKEALNILKEYKYRINEVPVQVNINNMFGGRFGLGTEPTGGL